ACRPSFPTRRSSDLKDRKDIQDAVYELSGDNYDVIAWRDSHAGSDGNNLVPVAVAGLGVQFRLGKVVTLSLEDKVSMTWRDGLRSEEHTSELQSREN